MIEELKKIDDKYIYIAEPVSEWLNLRDTSTGKSLLETYYDDSKRWAYSFQHCALVSRVEGLIEAIDRAPDDCIMISERSPLADKIFADCLFRKGLINDLEYKLYLRWFSFLMRRFGIQVHHVVYIDTDVDTCFDRIARRAREGEHVGKDYLTDLHEAHQLAVEELTGTIQVTRVPTIEGDPTEIARRVHEEIERHRSM